MVALRLLIGDKTYLIPGNTLRDRLIAHVPMLVKEIEATGPLGIGLATAARMFVPFVTTMHAKKHGLTPPDYAGLRKSKQDVLSACLYYWFDQTWIELSQSNWSVSTEGDESDVSWVTGLAPSPSFIEEADGGTDTAPNGDASVESQPTNLIAPANS